jgi:hypothetical protein
MIRIIDAVNVPFLAMIIRSAGLNLSVSTRKSGAMPKGFTSAINVERQRKRYSKESRKITYVPGQKFLKFLIH